MQDDAGLVRDDDAARSAALDTARSFIVQAPAGSGKTELLIQRYLRLLAGVSAPEEVLAITFTRKAAAEMRVRVIRALEGAAAGCKPSAAHEQVTFEAAQNVLGADRDHGWKLLDNPGRMRIQTLDSLNASIARKQPVTALGAASDGRIAADAGMKSLYREAAALTLDHLARGAAYRDATREVLRHLDTNAALYVDYVSRMLQTRDQWLPFVGIGNLDAAESGLLRKHFERGLEQAVTSQLAGIRDSFPMAHEPELVELGRHAARNLIESGQSGCPITALEDLDEVPGASTGALRQWLGIAELLLTGQGDYRKRVNRNQGFPAGQDEPKRVFADLTQALARHVSLARQLDGVRSLPPLHYSDDQWRVLLALFRLLPLAVMELKRLFAERNVVDHIEIALSASEALGTPEEPGDVALLLDYQVRHLLVDEMQDTSAAQYRMIEALTGGWEPGDGRTLCCVGDPMQSIYRFRNAEVGQFLLSKDTGLGSIRPEVLTLRRNFRSGAGLVEWFNAVFPGVMPARDDPTRSAVAYESAVPVRQLSGSGKCHVHPVFGPDPATEAEAGLAVLEGILENDPGEDVAVLVRSRSHLTELLRRLRENGIDYRAVEIDRLTDLPEIIDVLALTRALVHPGDRHAWLALLRGPWVGLDWTDLHAIVRNDRDTAVWELAGDPDIVARLSPAGRAAVARFREQLAPFMASSRTDSLRDRVERAWYALGGPAIPDTPEQVTNVYHFLDVLESLEVAGDLPDVAELEGTLDAEHVSSHAPSRVQVMTMHRAKGLQFDHVVLFGLGRRPPPREPGVMVWFDLPDEHGRPLKVISPVGPRAELERDPLHSYIGRVQAEMDDNEAGRLLYVACTRARKTLHLVGHAMDYSSGMRPEKRSLLHRLWPFVRDEFERRFDADAGDAPGKAEQSWLMPALRRFDQGWRLPEPPPLAASARQRPAETATVEFHWVGAVGRTAGTLVHRWLQYLVGEDLDVGRLDKGLLRRESNRWAREMGLAGAEADRVVSRVLEALGKLSSDPRGQWLLSGEGHAELALTGVLHGRTEAVVLDRVRIDDDGVHWIVDYKTSTHEGGNLQRFLDDEVRRYRGQLTKYAALYGKFAGVDPRCALYFPLLQEFVEIEPESS